MVTAVAQHLNTRMRQFVLTVAFNHKNFSASILKFLRTVIMGNSGAGKSWLAERLSRHLATPAIDLDEIYWEPGGYKTARARSLSAEMVREASKTDRWVIEGVYGPLVREALPYATALVWLDIDERECVANCSNAGFGAAAMRPHLLPWSNGLARTAFMTTPTHLQAINASFRGLSAQSSCFNHDRTSENS